MEFTFRLTGYRPPQTLRVADDGLEVLDEARRRQRSIPWNDIRKLQEYDGISAADPDGGPFPSKFFRVYASGGTQTFRNSYYLRPAGRASEAATDLAAEYETFLGVFLARLAAANPAVPMVSGWLLASLAWWCFALVGVWLFAMAVMLFFYDPLLTALGLSLLLVPMGLMALFSGFVFGREYWPTRTTVAAWVAARQRGLPCPPSSEPRAVPKETP